MIQFINRHLGLAHKKEDLTKRKNITTVLLVCFLVAFTTGTSSYLGGILTNNISGSFLPGTNITQDVFTVILANLFCSYWLLIGKSSMY